MQVDCVSDGDDALAQYSDCGPYDVVVTDQWHPGMHGIELIDAIRRINRAQAFILQSGNFATLIDDFHQKYADIPVLEKPYRVQNLVDLVQGLKR